MSVRFREGIHFRERVHCISILYFVVFSGYERYNAIRADPCLCFLARCGPPTSREDNPTGDPLDGEGRSAPYYFS